MSPPAFAAVLLALAIGGVLAWLALSADKPAETPKDETKSTLTVELGDQESGAAEAPAVEAEAPEGEQGEAAEVETAGEAEAEEKVVAVATKEKETEKEEKKEEKAGEQTESVEITLVRPPVEVEEDIALALPEAALLQETTRGALPIIGPEGREAWRVYAGKASATSNLPRMAVIISGLGLSTDATLSAIKLGKEVTLSFTAYGADLEAEVAAARAAGHEVLLDLPMEPISYPADDPGPHTLLTSLNTSDNMARLEWLLGRFKGYVGVINHMGSRFTAAREPLRPILQALKERGLMFVDSRSTNRSVAAGMAKQIKLPRAINDGFLDHEPTRGAIDQSFAAAESDARESGAAVVVARPFPVSLERIAAWLPMLKSRGIEVVPVSALADKQADR
ncbi:MAG: divergent polysaccharide deacetylase family protein [Alphaproteobacteria bacterium]|nr:divergent polysaccharide deacetylase family protein [Alphaproteobacteria bacterium]MDP6588777.1 divergent polysaccharide deacetylase family protein [Alphaproteobacteria bacterium]MDP6817373.1 divergent polysaccharide deacetylase family protein [Alphaproteobacteria bacterium]